MGLCLRMGFQSQSRVFMMLLSKHIILFRCRPSNGAKFSSLKVGLDVYDNTSLPQSQLLDKVSHLLSSLLAFFQIQTNLFFKRFQIIRKTCPCNEYPLKPHFYIVKTGVCRGISIFLILVQVKYRGHPLIPTSDVTLLAYMSTG